MPEQLQGGINLGFMFLPIYRGWVIIASLIICLATWFVIERTKLGGYLRGHREPADGAGFRHQRAAHDHADLRLWRRAGGAGRRLAAPIYQVSPQMGSDLIIVVFAVVVIGGMETIMGAIVTGFGLGLIEGLTKVFYPGPRRPSSSSS